MKSFIEALQQRQLLVFDGAMGTQLEERGMHPGPECNIKAPDIVADVHRAYIEAGANVLITNTLTANRLALGRSSEADLVKEYNAASVKICKEVAGDRAYVAGDVSSTGQFLEPYGDYTEEQFYEVFSEQAKLLAEAGVDLIIIETMTDLNEIVVAIKACKGSTKLPVIASMSFDPATEGFRTVMGNDVEACVKKMVEAGADVIGSNCGGITPEQMSEVIARMRQFTDKPLIAEPNAGLPELIDGKAQFNLPLDDFAAGVVKCVEAGALLVGGCCGTTPAHIAALRRAVDSLNR